jgi:hypothetical protein
MKTELFIFHFFVQSAPVQHPFIDEVETIITRNNIRGEIAHDGKKVMSMSEFVNIMKNKDKNDQDGRVIVSRLLKDDSPHKAYLESLGVYKMRNAHGRGTPAMTFLGLKGLLPKLTGEIAEKYTNYCTETTTRVEAGDFNMKKVIDANAASSNIYNAMARDALAQERASGGANIAESPMQVLDMCVYDVLFHLLSLLLNRFFFCDRYTGRVRAGRGACQAQAGARGVLAVSGEETCSARQGIYTGRSL